jgi:transcriptional regulator with XRE-family HTH domain
MERERSPDGKNTLEALRRNKGLSQEQLAAKCGLTRNAVARYEKGAEPKTSSFLKMCEVLEVSPLVLADALGFDVSGIPSDQKKSPQ